MDAKSLFDSLKQISVITINYNNYAGLKKTIFSVISQPKFKQYVEFIVIDGGSTDKSLSIIQENATNIHYWVSENDDGIFHAMNKGMNVASGNYIIYMNSGDTFCDNVITQQFIDNLNCDLVYGDYYVDKVSNKNYQKQTETIDFAYLISRTICHQALFIKRELCIKYPFEYTFNIIGDWMQLFKIMKHENPIVKYLNTPICVYNLDGISIQQDALRLEQRDQFLKLNYGAWELDTLRKIGRLRTRPTFHWIMSSLDSYKRSIILKWLSKIL